MTEKVRIRRQDHLPMPLIYLASAEDLASWYRSGLLWALDHGERELSISCFNSAASMGISLDEAADIANARAPEHLEVIVEDEGILPRLVNYGALFIGQEAGEVLGDYASGPNHTLPTMGAARYTGGLWVGTFLKVCTYQRYRRDAMGQVAPLAARMARGEGLAAHAAAAEVRLEVL